MDGKRHQGKGERWLNKPSTILAEDGTGQSNMTWEMMKGYDPDRIAMQSDPTGMQAGRFW